MLIGVFFMLYLEFIVNRLSISKISIVIYEYGVTFNNLDFLECAISRSMEFYSWSRKNFSKNNKIRTLLIFLGFARIYHTFEHPFPSQQIGLFKRNPLPVEFTLKAHNTQIYTNLDTFCVCQASKVFQNVPTIS